MFGWSRTLPFICLDKNDGLQSLLEISRRESVRRGAGSGEKCHTVSVDNARFT